MRVRISRQDEGNYNLGSDDPPIAERSPVIRITLSYVYNLANRLEPLSTLEAGQTVNSSLMILYEADQALSELSVSSVFAKYLRSSSPAAISLKAKISYLMKIEDLQHPISHYDIIDIKNRFHLYKIALLAEIGSLSAYFVEQKGGYDTHSLLNEGEALFPRDLLTKAPEAVLDARETAKALAFELPTAVGFHAFRVLECVLRRYLILVKGGLAPVRTRNLGFYIRELRKSGLADDKIVATLDQIRDLHRNPLVHPDVLLRLDEAIDILGVVRSAVSAMLNYLPQTQPTTLSALGAMLVPPSPGSA